MCGYIKDSHVLFPSKKSHVRKLSEAEICLKIDPVNAKKLEYKEVT